MSAHLAKRAATFASLVKLSHTIFAAPFAIAAAILATRRPHAEITVARVVAIAVCLVTARTAAMAYNRVVDRDVDAANPRTRQREIPAGAVTPRAAMALVAASSLLFVGSAATLGAVPAMLAVPVLLVLLGYSHAKRFTWAAHLWLGVALALAPGGAWLAMGAKPEAGILALMAAVLSWVGGFDVLYSLQDEAFDKAQGLRSIPARFGARGALAIARALHVGTVLALAAAARLLDGGVSFGLAVAVVAALLVYEHRLVRPIDDERVDLSRIDAAFFDVNGYVSLGFLALVALDVVVRR
ncbi:MAG: UbiA family prenyltransferase [Deltaproteobacteria bacterium]|nr:UbiA family prenyltransferase [Deltaproteobacteria bacterium]